MTQPVTIASYNVGAMPGSGMTAVQNAPVETSSVPPVTAERTDVAPDAAPNPMSELHGSETLVIASKPTWTLEENQSKYTGWVGMAALTFAAYAMTWYQHFRELPLQPRFLFESLPLGAYIFIERLYLLIWHYRYAAGTGFVLGAMAVYELAVVRVYKRQFDFSAPRVMDEEAWRRVRARCVALYACFVPATFLYVTLGEYCFYVAPYPDHWYYSHFRTFYLIAAPLICVLCWPYFYCVERYARPEGAVDEFLVLSRWLKKSFAELCSGDPQQRHENAHVKNLARGLLVKFFFIPVMVSFCFGNWSNWQFHAQRFAQEFVKSDWTSVADIGRNTQAIAAMIFAFILLVDVCIGLVGYLASCRMLDTQVTSAEPTLLGWVVALLCYPPISRGITGIYLEYNQDEIWSSDMYNNYAVMSIVCTILSLGLMGAYAWATVAFGLRFSNLTNRGIIASGPYKYIRHPAYTFKNFAWWLAALPTLLFAMTHARELSYLHGMHSTRLSPGYDVPGLALLPIFAVRLIGSNVIYGLRAITEERHLMREPHYREYCKKVPWRFIPGVW